MEIIKFKKDNYSQYTSVVLSGVEYVLHLRWNGAMRRRTFTNSGWYLSIYDADTFDWADLDGNGDNGSLIRGGIKLMPNKGIVKDYDFTIGGGDLVCMDYEFNKTLQGLDEYRVTLDNFNSSQVGGNRFRIVYFSEEEILELKSYTQSDV